MKSLHSRKRIIIAGGSLAVLLLVLLASPASAHAIEPLYKVLKTNTNIKDVWTQVRNMVNIVIIAALVFIAFANILRINLNNYAIKKFLPALVFGVILANFSYFICQVFIDLANVAMSLLMNGATGASASNYVGSGKVGVAGAFDFSSMQIDVKNLPRSFVYIVFEIVGAILVYILAILFFIRNYIIYFLVALSPLAMMATILPETKTVWKQWSSQFFKWTFMPLISLFWLWLGGMWWSSGFNPSGGGSAPTPGGEFNSSLFGVLFAGFCYYLAITSPWKMGGEIMGKWGGLAKKAWGHTGGAAWNATGGAIGRQVKSDVGDYYQRQKGHLKNRFYSTKMGKSMAARREDFKLKNEIPGMIRDNQAGELRKDQAWRMLRDPKLDEIVKKRLRSKIFRSEVSDELKNNTVLVTGDPDQVWGMIKKDPILDAAGNPTGRYKIYNPLVNPEKFTDASDAITSLAAQVKLRQLERNARTMPDRAKAKDYLDNSETEKYKFDSATGRYVNTTDNPRNVDSSGFGSSDVLDLEAARSLTPDNIATAREASRTGQTDISDQSVAALVHAMEQNKSELAGKAEHDVAVASTVAERLSGASSQAGGGDDGIVAARGSLAHISRQTEIGLEALKNSDVESAQKAAIQISSDFETSLAAHDPEKMAEKLGNIFESTQKETARLQATNLAEELNKYQTNSSGWKQERLQSEMSSVDMHAELQAINQTFASQISNLQSASVAELQGAMGQHIDTLVDSNESLQRAMESNPGLSKTDIKNELTQSINASISSKMGAGNAADPTANLRDAMISALTSNDVNKSLARSFQQGSEKAAKSAPTPRAVHDVRPPSGSGI